MLKIEQAMVLRIAKRRVPRWNRIAVIRENLRD